MDDAAGLEYMQQHFIKHTAPGQDGQYRILIVDGHSSHHHWGVVETALDNNIHMLCLPPHSTHIMQPLDVGCFGVLTKAYKKSYRDWTYEHLYEKVHKKEFWEILVPARKETYQVSTILSAWKESGCWPVRRFPNTKPPPNANKNHQSTSAETFVDISGDHANTLTTPPPKHLADCDPIPAVCAGTPHKIRSLAEQLRCAVPLKSDHQVLELLEQFTNLSLEKLTPYRDIQSQAATIKVLRSGKQVKPSMDMRWLTKGRILDRKHVQAGLERIQRESDKQVEARRKREEKAKLAEGKKLLLSSGVIISTNNSVVVVLKVPRAALRLLLVRETIPPTTKGKKRKECPNNNSPTIPFPLQFQIISPCPNRTNTGGVWAWKGVELAADFRVFRLPSYLTVVKASSTASFP